jgi:hypothetical protein
LVPLFDIGSKLPGLTTDYAISFLPPEEGSRINDGNIVALTKPRRCITLKDKEDKNYKIKEK